jgi:hypothetical protein
MAHEILEAYKLGKKIKHKSWSGCKWFSRGENCFSYPVYNVGVSDMFCTLNALLVNPDLFEIYQEPKKAWIETREFFNTGILQNNDSARSSGAIALAREFLKRYKEIAELELSEKLDITKTVAYEVLRELIGEENLKGDK